MSSSASVVTVRGFRGRSESPLNAFPSKGVPLEIRVDHLRATAGLGTKHLPS